MTGRVIIQGLNKPLVTLTPVLHHKFTEEVALYTGKGKAQMTETPTHPHLLMNYIIWNIRGDNVKFHRHCTTMVQLHKPMI